jgi:hypothetical protein
MKERCRWHIYNFVLSYKKGEGESATANTDLGVVGGGRGCRRLTGAEVGSEGAVGTRLVIKSSV